MNPVIAGQVIRVVFPNSLFVPPDSSPVCPFDTRVGYSLRLFRPPRSRFTLLIAATLALPSLTHVAAPLTFRQLAASRQAAIQCYHHQPIQQLLETACLLSSTSLFQAHRCLLGQRPYFSSKLLRELPVSAAGFAQHRAHPTILQRCHNEPLSTCSQQVRRASFIHRQIVTLCSVST